MQHMNSEPPDDKPKIIEPPINPDTDTRPLKPLRVTDEPPSDRMPSLRDRRPPATILREATPTSAPDMRRIAPPAADDTDRVRLVPRPPEASAWRLILTSQSSKQSTIGLDVRETLTIGRSDPDSAQPDLDLTPHLALDHGVSRQHAVLIPAPEALYLVDLDSKNGTWINGIYLTPGERHPLNPGDKIELGLLKLLVKSLAPFSRSAGDSA
jgi:hypothetical protein